MNRTPNAVASGMTILAVAVGIFVAGAVFGVIFATLTTVCK